MSHGDGPGCGASGLTGQMEIQNFQHFKSVTVSDTISGQC